MYNSIRSDTILYFANVNVARKFMDLRWIKILSP